MAVADTISNSSSIDTQVDLTLALDTGNWSDNNGGTFYVLLEIAEPAKLTE